MYKRQLCGGVFNLFVNILGKACGLEYTLIGSATLGKVSPLHSVYVTQMNIRTGVSRFHFVCRLAGSIKLNLGIHSSHRQLECIYLYSVDSKKNVITYNLDERTYVLI